MTPSQCTRLQFKQVKQVNKIVRGPQTDFFRLFSPSEAPPKTLTEVSDLAQESLRGISIKQIRINIIRLRTSRVELVA